MKKLFILFSVFLVFLSISIPCFATNEGLYGHYISAGHYLFDDTIDGLGANNIRIYFDFQVQNGNRDYNSIVYADNVLYVYGESIDQNTGTVYNKNTGWVNDDYRHIIIPHGFYITDSFTYLFFVKNLNRVDGDYQSSLSDEFLSIFAYIGTWIGSAFSSLQAIFFVEGSLTVIGTLSVMGLAFAVILLLFNMIRSFLKFR